jgi:hypothetical protein
MLYPVHQILLDLSIRMCFNVLVLQYIAIRLKSSVRDEGLSCCLILLIAYRLLCIYLCVSKLHSECVHYMLLKETHTQTRSSYVCAGCLTRQAQPLCRCCPHCRQNVSEQRSRFFYITFSNEPNIQSSSRLAVRFNRV